MLFQEARILLEI